LPASATDALPALVAIASVALFAPGPAGAKRTLAVHDCDVDSARPAVQLPPSAKSAGAAPASEAEITVSVPPPVLATVTFCDALCVPATWFANDSAAVDTLSAGGSGDAVPVPDSATAGTLPLDSATSSVALRVPTASGENVSTTVQVAAAPSVVPNAQVPARLKSARAAPASVRPVTEKVPLPTLDSTSVFATLVVYTVWLPNAAVDGDSDGVGLEGVVPVPESSMR
jgi:hypothetical protein